MKIKLVIPIILIFIMTSCAPVITGTADEIRINDWSATLKNGSVVTLSFDEDYAEFKINSTDKDAEADIKGLGVIDNRQILIYNQSEIEPYYFKYSLNNNKLTLKYNGGKVVLTRDN